MTPAGGISVLVPVLNRPHRAQPLADNLHHATRTPHELVFLCSPDDHEQIAACERTQSRTIIVPWQPGPGDYARKINHGYRSTSLPYLLLGADDLHFDPGWDTTALDVAERTGAGVIGTNDHANPLVKRGRHATHPLVTRHYIETHGGTWHDGPGIVYHEGYDHQCVDNELVQAAIDRNAWTFAANAGVHHHHPMYHKATPMDATYEKALRHGRQDKLLYLERQAQARPRR
jgi:hypothetical protein